MVTEKVLTPITLFFSLIEKWEKTLDNKGYTGAVLIDLSKAFGTTNYELSIAKLYTCGFSKDYKIDI